MPVQVKAQFVALGALIMGVSGCNRETAWPMAEVSSANSVQHSLDSWSVGSSLLIPRYLHGAASGAGKIYAIGGIGPVSPPDATGAVWLLSAEAFDAATGTWSYIGALPTEGACMNGTAFIGGALYVVVGRSPNGVLAKYDPTANSWSASLIPFALPCNGATGTINGKLYFAYPCTSYRCQGTKMLEFDPSTNAWRQREPLRRRQHASGPAAGVVNGRLYIVGGADNGLRTTDVDIYDPVTDSWSTAPSLPSVQYYAAGVGYQGKLYVVGGEDNNNIRLTKLSIFDEGSNTWSNGSSMLTSRIALGFVELSGQLYAIGGSGDPTGNPVPAVEIYSP